jgi:hypothetical protein
LGVHDAGQSENNVDAGLGCRFGIDKRRLREMRNKGQNTKGFQRG